MKVIYYFIAVACLCAACESKNAMNVSSSSQQADKALLLCEADSVLTITESLGDTVIYRVPDVLPQYVLGAEAAVEFYTKAMHVPDSIKSGDKEKAVFFTFVVEKDGSMSYVKKIKGVEAKLDAQAQVVLKKMRWKPAYKEGKVVRSWFTFGISVYKP